MAAWLRIAIHDPARTTMLAMRIATFAARLWYMSRISKSSMITIGAVISAAMLAWFRLAYTSANLSTIAYISTYIAAKDSTVMTRSFAYWCVAGSAVPGPQPGLAESVPRTTL